MRPSLTSSRRYRGMKLDRKANRIEILDRYAMHNRPGKIALTMMTALKPVASRGCVDIGSRAKILFEAGALHPELEELARSRTGACACPGVSASLASS